MNIKIIPTFIKQKLGISKTGKIFSTKSINQITPQYRSPGLTGDILQIKNSPIKASVLPEKNITKESTTIQKLYSPDFKIKANKNNEGYYITTIIDRATNKPVKAYIKRIRRTEYKDCETSALPNIFEKWSIFTKNKNGEYESVGNRAFIIDRNQRSILPNWMDSIKGSKKYKGIGLRCHQLTIERMLQENIDNIQISSVPDAFLFHYKSGFRAQDKNITKTNYIKFINNIKMILPQKELNEWIKRIHKCPIFPK